MKKILSIFSVVLLLSACSLNTSFTKKDTISASYNSKVISSSDFETILPLLNDLQLTKRKINVKKDAILTITTTDNIYHFIIANNNTIKCLINNKTYYSANKRTITKLSKSLKKILSKYNNKTFYSFIKKNNYQPSNNDLFLKIDTINQYFILTSSIPLKKVQVHKVEVKNNTFVDIDLIKSLINVKANTNIVFRINPIKDYYTYRIVFTNIYNLTTSIIPTYDIDKENGQIKFIITYK